jgi:hypothetical protein
MWAGLPTPHLPDRRSPESCTLPINQQVLLRPTVGPVGRSGDRPTSRVVPPLRGSGTAPLGSQASRLHGEALRNDLQAGRLRSRIASQRCGRVTLMWAGLPTRPPARPKVSRILHPPNKSAGPFETYGRARGAVGRPPHIESCSTPPGFGDGSSGIAGVPPARGGALRNVLQARRLRSRIASHTLDITK